MQFNKLNKIVIMDYYKGEHLYLKYILMKHLLLLITISLISVASNAQKQSIYYLADSSQKVNNKKMIDIGSEAGGRISYYHIFEKLFPGSKREISFTYHEQVGKKYTLKPTYKYTDTKQLIQLVHKDGPDFNDKYDLYVVEPTTKNRFKTNKVKLVYITDNPVY